MPASPSPASARRARLADAAILAPLAVTAIVLYPITRSCFRADDFLNLYQINNYSLWQYLVIPNAGHLLFARNAIFYACWLLFGAHAWPYLWLAFVTHLSNTALLYLVIRHFTDSRSAAVLGATLWGVCALHVDSVGYYAVYGHVLVGSALLLVLLTASYADAARTPPRPALVAFWYALALGAATCFGTGIALAMMLPFVLALLLPDWRRAWRLRLPLVSLLAVVPFLYWALYRLYDLAFDLPPPIGRFVLMIESLPAVPLGFVRAVGFALFRLLLRPLPVDWTFPIAYVLVALAAAGLAAYAWRAPPAGRRRIAACLLLALGCYGVVVVARIGRLHDLPASEMAADGRLHYAPLIPVTILLAYLWQAIAARLPQASTLVAGTVCVALAVPSIGPVPRNERCVATDRLLRQALMRIGVTLRMAPPEQLDIAIANRRFHPTSMSVVFPGWAGLFTIFYPSNVAHGHRVVFIDPDPEVIAWAQRGQRSRTLLIAPPPEVPSMEQDGEWCPAHLPPQLSPLPPADPPSLAAGRR